MDQHCFSPPMGESATITRRSIFAFLQNFQLFTSTPALLALPFAVSTLLAPSLVSSSYLLPLVHGRLRSLLLAAGLPTSSQPLAILSLRLSQTILSSLFVSPFSLSFLLLAKASVVRALHHDKALQKHAFPAWIVTFNPLFTTHLCNSLLILSALTTSLCLLVMSFNSTQVLGLSSHGTILLLSATGALVFSVVLANVHIVCNLSLVLSGLEMRGGFSSILKACVLIRGRAATALSISLPVNAALAAVDALFQHRVVRAYHRAMAPNSSMVVEAIFVAYLYAILLVLDTIVCCMFVRSCRPDYQIGQEERNERSIRRGKVSELVLC